MNDRWFYGPCKFPGLPRYSRADARALIALLDKPWGFRVRKCHGHFHVGKRRFSRD